MSGWMDAVSSFIEWFLEYYAVPMLANAAPVLVHGSRRIDCGLVLGDGRPLLGAGKTWEGFFMGVFMGWLVSIPIYYYFENPYIPIVSVFAAASALIGDMVGSFIKRRLGIPRGDPAPVLDQLDFALMSSLYYWFVSPGFRRPDYILYSLLIILVLHVLTNNTAYYLGLKDRRW